MNALRRDRSRPLRIGFVYDCSYPESNGGAERRYHEIATRLTASCDVEYVTWTWWPGRRDRVVDGVSYHGVGQAPALYGRDGKRRVSEAIAFAVRLVPALLRTRVDVLDVSATPTVPLYGAWLAATITRTPLVVTWHEYWGSHWHTYLPESRVLATVARLLESVSRVIGDRIIAVSPYTAERMGEGRWSRRTTVVGNGVRVAEIAATPAAAEPIDLVYLGRLIDEKRVELFVRAAALLAAERPGLQCLVIGDGPERARLEGLATELGLGETIRFAGRLPGEEVQAALRAATALVLPSAREGYGVVVVEAQAAGAIPIVTTGPATAAPALVRHGIDGLVVDPTPAAIAAAARSLLDDPEGVALMRAAAAQTAQLASWDEVSVRMLEIYRAAARGEAAVPLAAPLPSGDPA